MKNIEFYNLKTEIRTIKEQLWENEKQIIKQQTYIEQILKNQQNEIMKAHDYVVIVDNINNVKVYEKGKDITNGITNIKIAVNEIPTIEYEKVMLEMEK